MSDENVTYVGGQAVEQHEAAETQMPGEDRDAAIAAVKEALEAEGKKAAEAAKEADENDIHKPKGMKKDGPPPKDPKTGKFLPRDGQDAAGTKENPEDSENIDPDTANVKQVLKARQKIAAQKQKQQQEYQQQQQELQRQYYQIQQMAAKVERDRQLVEQLKKDPVRAVREAGWDPEEFIMSLAKEGTEEGKMARLLREQNQRLDEMNRWKEEQARAAQEAQERAQYQQMVQYRQQMERQFLGHVASEENFPHINTFYNGREHSLIAEADMVAAQYRELTGKEASLEDIAEYIEEVLAERAGKWYDKTKSSKVNAPSNAGKPARGATGKTLTNSDASDRRSVGKDISELDGDERLEAARTAVRAALAHSSTE